MAVLPQNITNEYENTADVIAAVDYSGYTVINITDAVTDAELRGFVTQYTNLALVLQRDVIAEGSFRFGAGYPPKDTNICQKLIIDLNGYSISVSGGNLDFYVPYLEIRDSSAAGTGQIDADYILVAAPKQEVSDVIIRGGRLHTIVSGSGVYAPPLRIVKVYGGLVDGFDTVDTVWVAPWVDATYDDNGAVVSATEIYNYYAVSTTPYASGVYNYAYALGWEMNATELSTLAIATGKTYYLWGRDKDGWYQYLNLACTDGQNWQNAA